MTYCAGLSVAQGLVFISDSRTNAGSDHISTYSKMYSFGIPGERQLVICAAGNLATTQAVMLQVEKDIQANAPVNLMNVKRMSEAATYMGSLNLAQQEVTGGGPVFSATFLIGGEILGARPRLMMVYPEGNYIASSAQAPFLQIGEVKYGKPILDRVITKATSLKDAATAAILSMDATTRSNLTVGPPIELSVYEAGSLQPCRYRRFEEHDPYLLEIRKRWGESLIAAFAYLPEIEW